MCDKATCQRQEKKRKREKEIERHFAKDFTSFLRSGDNDVECILCASPRVSFPLFGRWAIFAKFVLIFIWYSEQSEREIGRESSPRKIANQHVGTFDTKETICTQTPVETYDFLGHSLNDPFLHELYSLPPCVCSIAKLAIYVFASAIFCEERRPSFNSWYSGNASVEIARYLSACEEDCCY